MFFIFMAYFIFKVLTKRSREKEVCLYSVIRYLFN